DLRVSRRLRNACGSHDQQVPRRVRIPHQSQTVHGRELAANYPNDANGRRKVSAPIRVIGNSRLLWLWCRRWQLPGFAYRLEAFPAVRSITKWLVLRKPAAAQRDRRTA